MSVRRGLRAAGLGLALAAAMVPATSAASLFDCSQRPLLDADGRFVAGIQDIAHDAVHRRILIATHHVPPPGRGVPQISRGGLHALPEEALASGPLIATGLPSLTSMPMGIVGFDLQGKRLAAVTVTTMGGKPAMATLVADLETTGPRLLEAQLLPGLCRATDAAHYRDGTILVAHASTACDVWPRWVDNILRPAGSNVLAIESGDQRVFASGFRAVSGLAIQGEAVVVAVAPDFRLHHMGPDGLTIHPLPFAPNKLATSLDGSIWAAGARRTNRGWQAPDRAGEPVVARLDTDGRLSIIDLPSGLDARADMAVPVGPHVILAAAGDSSLLVCGNPFTAVRP